MRTEKALEAIAKSKLYKYAGPIINPLLKIIEKISEKTTKFKDRLFKGKQKADEIQIHHKAPWANKAFNHQNHPLVKQSKVDLKTHETNLMPLGGHSGPHSAEYHRGVQNIFNKHYSKVKGKGQRVAHEELDKALKEIQNEISKGTLKPYQNKDVWIP